MEIQRQVYLDKLIRKEKNGLIKVVTGRRRCGKSYLLFRLFQNYLLTHGVSLDHIISVALDDRTNKEFRDPDRRLSYVKNRIRDDKEYYVILDEVQYLNEFEDVLNSLLHIPNADVYVTGSNSKFLSSDVITEFRGRGDEIHVYPLSFSEIVSAYPGDKDIAFDDFLTYGGLPQVLTRENSGDKEEYLESLFQKVYLSGILERHRIQSRVELDELLDVLASGIGSYTNETKLSHTFMSVKGKKITDKTIKNYISYLRDSFLINRAVRYDIKGKKYIGSLSKYYFEDVGLRNACLGFRQVEQNHLRENIIFNELRNRGYHVDIGIVEKYGPGKEKTRSKKQLEIDFVATRGSEKYYIQSAFALPDSDKVSQEKRGLLDIPDSFRKIIVVGDKIRPKHDENGITRIGIENFLLDPNSLNL